MDVCWDRKPADDRRGRDDEAIDRVLRAAIFVACSVYIYEVVRDLLSKTKDRVP